MNVYTFIICILLTSVSDYKPVFSRSTYDNPSYNNDRDENLSVLSAHQKKRVTNEDALRDEDQAEEYEHNVPLYEAQRYRKYDPETSFRHDNRLEKNRELFDESKLNSQKRDYFDGSNNPKDASIEVILDPRAKKAVAVVENSPTGQAMYDLSGWKNNKDDGTAYESDQYTPGTQEQVVNLVYPAERNERKYAANSFESNSDYSEKTKAGFKDKLIENERAGEDTHKRKRNAEAKNKIEKETEKRSSKDKTKRKSDQKSNSKSNECPPHNTPSTMESDSNKNDNDDKFEKQQNVKREAPQWSQAQLDALKNSLAHVNDNSGEVQNLRNILTDMGLINDAEINKKRETAKADTTSSPTEKFEEDKEKMSNDLKADIEDEDLNQDNIILKRNGREININEEEDINKSPVELIEKREADEENNSEEEENEESFDTKNEKKEMKRSNIESEKTNAATKVEGNEKEVAKLLREKRQDTDTNKNLNEDKAETAEKSKDTPGSDSEMNKNANDNTKIYTKRETNSDSSKERKNRENQENEEEYEKRMESQIQAKIDAIKEKVKREILEEQLKRRYKRNLNIDEALKTNIRKRRQTKEQAKEETKAVKDTDNINKENDVASSGEPEAKIVRRKRANTLPEKQMVYRAYQADQDEEADDDGEFDDNSYDGRMYLEKRQAEDENDYYDPVRKREVEGYLQQYYPEPRNRRSFNNDGFAEDSNAFHGGRRALKNKSFAGRENQEEYNAKSNENNDNEYFGSLPQTYNGELTRYKRVKRDNPYK